MHADNASTPLHTFNDSEPTYRPVLVKSNSYRRFALTLVCVDLLFFSTLLYSVIENFRLVHTRCATHAESFSTHDSVELLGRYLTLLYICGSLMVVCLITLIISRLYYLRTSSRGESTGSLLWHARIAMQLISSLVFLVYALSYASTLHMIANSTSAAINFPLTLSFALLCIGTLANKLTLICIAAKHWSALKKQFNIFETHIVQLELDLDLRQSEAPNDFAPLPGDRWTNIPLESSERNTSTTTTYKLATNGMTMMDDDDDAEGLQVRFVPFDKSSVSNSTFVASEDYNSRYGTVRRRDHMDSPRRFDDGALTSEQHKNLLGEESETRFGH